MTVDSGAIDTVTPPDVAKAFPIHETQQSKAGINYRAANGSKIRNHGARQVQGVSNDFKSINMKMNVADVKKTLAAAIQLNYAGNKVILDGDESYIENKASGEIIPLQVVNGEYVFDLWVQAAAPEQVPVKIKGNRYAALVEEDNDDDDCSSPFAGQEQ